MRVWGVGVSRGFGKFAGSGAVVLLFCFSFASAAFGQITTGTVTGTITDTKGAAMAGVSVQVHNDDTGTDTPVVSNDSGIYNAPFLQPGNYTVTAAKTGFNTVENKGVKVEVGGARRVDIQMPVASLQSLVTVTTEVPLIETEKTQTSQTISENLVTDLPVSSRRWEQFVLLTPGVVTDGSNNNVAFHGVNSMYNNNAVDGANNNNAYNSTGRGNANSGSSGDDGYTYSSDAIREFQVSSNNYAAELGQAAGGQINAVTKSGTNAIHADIFYNLRVPNLNAIDPSTEVSLQAQGLSATQTVHQQNQFGGSVGGPIIKDKLFYFLNYDGYRKVTPVAYTTSAGLSNTPSINSLVANYCPAGLPLVAGGTLVQAQCAAAGNWLNTENLGTFPREIVQDIALGKLDYQINAANHVNATFNWRNWAEPAGTAFAGTANSGLAANANFFIKDRFVISSLNTIIGGNKVNELRFQFGEDNSYELWNAPAPNVALTNLFAYGQNNANPQRIYETRYQFADNFSFSRGRHSFKTGVDVNLVEENAHISINSSGVYTYSGVALPAGVCTPATGSSQTAATEIQTWCDWLLDLYGVNTGTSTGRHWSNFSQMKDQRFPGNQLNPAGAGTDQFMDQDYAGYFQDTWKVRPNITVDAGLRYDVQLYPSAPNPNLRTALLALYTSNIPPIDYGGIQPRLGVAWNLAKNTVIRAGFGTFFAKTTNSTISSARRTSGTREQSFSCTLTSATCNGLSPSGAAIQVLQFPDVFYAQMAQAPGAPFSSSLLSASQQPLVPVVTNPPGDFCANNPACAVRGFDPNAVRPRALEGEVSLERQIPGNIGFTATYIVTRGEHLPVHYDANLAPSTGMKSYDIVNSSGATLQTIQEPFFFGVPGVSGRLDNTTGPILAEFSVVNSWYNALALTFRKPATHGVELVVNYTLAKGVDDGEAGGVASGGIFLGGETPANPYDIKGEYGRSNIDVRNRLTASVVWTPMYAKGLNRYARATFDGWNLSTIITASSGEPYSGVVQTAAAQCFLPVSPCPAADTGEDGGVTGATLGSSGAPAGGRLAWMPRNSYSLPGYSNVDLRLAKAFTVHERFNFEFRAEAFNLFNSYILQGVNTNAYTFSNPVAASGSNANPACNLAAHTNECLVPSSTFQTPTTTSGFLLGSRQIQFGFRFGF